MPPVLGRLMSGTFWMALRTPLQAVLAFFSIPLIIGAIGPKASSAYAFAWGFGFFQFLFEFGMSSSLQRQASETWTRGDRAGVDRVIACGMNFYAAMAVVQVLALLGVAYLAVPHSVYDLEGRRLIVKLLWLQVFTTPCFGLSMVASSVLQAARRYDFLPRFELAIIILRFVVLVVGLAAGVDFFLVVVAQTVVQIGLSLGPSLWVMVRELGHVPHFHGARREDYAALLHISFYMFLIQLSVVLADKIDTTILGFALDDEAANAVYMFVSKPFVQIRQTGWTLAYLVMPAVASLAAARDLRGLERVKYDGPRLHIGVLMPIALLAFVYAGPFLSLWVGDRLGYDAARARPAPAALPGGHPPAGARRAGADGHRHEQDQGHRAGGPGRLAGQPADQLFPDAPAGGLRGHPGGLRGHLGDGADDPLLEPPRARRLRLPRPGGPAADLPGEDPERPARRGRRPGGVDLVAPHGPPARSPGHDALGAIDPAARAPGVRQPRLRGGLPGRPDRPRRPGRPRRLAQAPARVGAPGRSGHASFPIGRRRTRLNLRSEGPRAA